MSHKLILSLSTQWKLELSWPAMTPYSNRADSSTSINTQACIQDTFPGGTYVVIRLTNHLTTGVVHYRLMKCASQLNTATSAPAYVPTPLI